MILVIDNYDSFVHNLARYFRQLGIETAVFRNDKITLEQIRELNPNAIVISPGPCTPDQAGCSMSVVREFGASLPILGVCLGHQAIVQAYGGTIIRANEPMHGRSSRINHNEEFVFESLPTPMTVGRYHSLVACPDSMPACLRVTAQTEDSVMAVQHRDHPVIGLQFHPESVLTEHGYALIRNFLNFAGISPQGVQLGGLNASQEDGRATMGCSK